MAPCGLFPTHNSLSRLRYTGVVLDPHVRRGTVQEYEPSAKIKGEVIEIRDPLHRRGIGSVLANGEDIGSVLEASDERMQVHREPVLMSRVMGL